MSPPSPASDGVGTSHSHTVTVEAKDTVGFLVPGMPMVAATPYLVTIAEIASYEIAKQLIPADHITVGARVVIDHLGASKVGATLVAQATLIKRDRNKFTFAVTVTDGERTVANVEHVRAAVPLQKILAATA